MNGESKVGSSIDDMLNMWVLLLNNSVYKY